MNHKSKFQTFITPTMNSSFFTIILILSLSLQFLSSASMEDHTIHANNNGDVENSNAEVQRSINRLKEMNPNEMQIKFIDLLKRKTKGESLDPYVIEEVDDSSLAPAEIVARLKQDGENGEWFFFGRNKTISKGGVNMDRSAGEGKWSGNGPNKPIHDGEATCRKYFILEGTPWRKHEYVLHPKQGNGCAFVRLFKNPETPSNNSTTAKRKAGRSQQKGKKAAKPEAINVQVPKRLNANEDHSVYKYPARCGITNIDTHPLNANDAFSQLSAMTGNNTDQNQIDILNDTDKPGVSYSMFTSAGLISEDQLLDRRDVINDIQDFPADQMENFDGELDTAWFEELLNQL